VVAPGVTLDRRDVRMIEAQIKLTDQLPNRACAVIIFDRDCARERQLPIRPIVCFEVGRFALTQSSRPILTQRCSRKWMSGHAAYALVLLEDRGQFARQQRYSSGEHLPPSRGESPLPLDRYLSWMSRIIPHQCWVCPSKQPMKLCTMREHSEHRRSQSKKLLLGRPNFQPGYDRRVDG
jgi:hypothetical protein